MSSIVWGWELTLELFLVGLGSAAIIVSFLAELMKKDKVSYTAMAAAYVAPIATIFGIVVLILHLGALFRAPWNILYIIFEPNLESQLATRTWAIIGLTVLMVLVFASYLFKGSQKLTLTLQGVASVLAFYVLMNGGIILSYSRGIAFWSTPVLPWILTISSFPAAFASIGLAIPIFAQFWPRLFENMAEVFKSGKQYKTLTYNILTTSIPFLIATLILVLVHIALTFGVVGQSVMLMGDMAMFFWAYVVAGTAIPIIIWWLSRSATTKSAWANYISYLLILAGVGSLNFAIMYAPQITKSILNF